MNGRTDTFTFVLDQLVMKQVIKIFELPSKIQEIKKHIYYVATHGNLFALSKKDHRI